MNIPNIDEVIVNNTFEGISILHLSDLHINKITTKQQVKELVKVCNKSLADIVVITGDIIDCKVKFIKEELNILNFINKKCFYISGNHDLFYGFKEVKTILRKFTCLDNSFEVLQINNQEIAIGGLSDRFSKFFGVKREEKKVVEFLKNYKNSILLAHQPKDYTYALEASAKLFLCGHTHGGQIYPFHYVVRLFQPFLNGLIYKNNTAIYVSKGIGNWGIDFRFKAKNEICLLKLTSKGVE